MLTKLRANQFICIWSIWNGLFLALLAVMTLLGWTIATIQQDRTPLSYLIVIVFSVGWVFSLHRAIWVSRMVRSNALSQTYSKMLSAARSPEDAREAFQTMLSEKTSVLEYIGRTLVSLGLVGTVIGIMIGMSEVRADMVGNLDLAAQAMTTMFKGLAVGFTTTLIGSAGMIWMQFQEKLIGAEISRLYQRVLAGV